MTLSPAESDTARRALEDRAKAGLEFVRGLVDGSLPLNTMARTLSYDVVEASEGRVVVTAVPTAEQLNPEGTVHGGLAATLLDSCRGLAVRTLTGAGTGSTTLEFKIAFIRPITPETGPVRGRRRCAEHGASRRLSRRPSDRSRWQVAGARHDDLPGLRKVDDDLAAVRELAVQGGGFRALSGVPSGIGSRMDRLDADLGHLPQ